MNLNITLVSELAVFGVFLSIVKARIWPHFTDILEKRQLEISDGLAASAQAKESLEKARKESSDLIAQARHKGEDLLRLAQMRADKIEQEAREHAQKTLEISKRQATLEVSQIQEQFLSQAKSHYVELVSQALLQINQHPQKEEFSLSLIEAAQKEQVK